MPKPKKKVTITSTESVEEYLARGGTITVCEPGARTEDLYVGQWGRKKAPAKSNNDVKAKADK